MDEQINKTGFPNVKGIDFTKPSKHGMATALKDLMMSPRKADESLPPNEARRKFELPFDKDVQAELNIEQWEQTPGSEIYTFNHPERTHDDRFWAICLAVVATLKTEPAPKLWVVPR